jgi:hypothetical protein
VNQSNYSLGVIAHNRNNSISKLQTKNDADRPQKFCESVLQRFQTPKTSVPLVKSFQQLGINLGREADQKIADREILERGG